MHGLFIPRSPRFQGVSDYIIIQYLILNIGAGRSFFILTDKNREDYFTS